jgi:RNA 2',3'-cyclic 3'-phosphodiesterase
MEKIRSFIAIELPAEVKQSLTGLQLKLKPSGGNALKWVEPRNIHLTLQFLGDVDTDKIPNINAAMESAVKGIPPFSFKVSGLGVFPNRQRMRVVWAGLTGDLEKLGNLQKNIEEALKPLGFTPDGKGFSPHLTIARVRDFARPEDLQKLSGALEKTVYDAGQTVTVNSINLMKSQLTREGPIYSKIAAVTLKS